MLTNGDQIFPPMLEAVNSAQRRISFETYIYNEGTVGQQFTDAFIAAAKRGVQVHLVLDAIGSSKVPKEWHESLKAAGAKLGEFGRTKWYSIEELNYRTHRKILVVDGRVGFTGGVGLDDQWLGNAQDKEHWRDTMVQIEGPVVRLMEGAFNENFIETLGPVTPIGRSAGAGAGRAARQRNRAAQLPIRRRQRPEEALPADDRGRAPHARHRHAVLRDRRIQRLGARRGA